MVFVARNNSEKVVIKKLVGEDEKEKRLFLKEAKILYGTKSEHIVKFKAVCMHFFSQFLYELESSALRTVVVKLIYSPTRFV